MISQNIEHQDRTSRLEIEHNVSFVQSMLDTWQLAVDNRTPCLKTERSLLGISALSSQKE